MRRGNAESTNALIPNFFLGKGIFRTIKVEDGNIRHWRAHLQKIQNDCRFLHLPMPSIKEEELYQLLNDRKALQGIWRLKIICTQSWLAILEPYESKITEKSLTVFPHPVVRPSAKIKSLSYLDNLLVARYAQERGFDDALMVNHQDALLETSKANFLWVWNNTLYVSDPSLPYYEGVMQGLYISCAIKMGMQVQACHQSRDSLPLEAHLYTCNAMQGLVPVIKIGQQTFKRNPLLEEEFHRQLNSL